MNFSQWEQTVAAEIKGDSVWKSEAYRLALFAADLGWSDATKLLSDKRTISLADQLYRSVGAVSADLEEGYSRGTGRDRARFYEYGLGSARESRGWYFKGRHVLGQEVAEHRMRLFTQIIKLLLTMVPDQRGQTLHEESPQYPSVPKLPSSDGAEKGDELLEIIPMP
ncbi:MAG: four helix bundle protein [Verrucomicrobia bacterium]|nr:four helix bundle protein [Verrucomicrobiota bacterium]